MTWRANGDALWLPLIAIYNESRKLVSSEPSLDAEHRLAQKVGGDTIAGVDEAGRGPWAGPVVAAAVILKPSDFPEGLNDSKKLTEAQRERLFDEIFETSQVGIGLTTVTDIDRDNILQATMAAMSKAVAELSVPPQAVLIDGNKCPPLPCPGEPLVNGDALSLSIAAASIVAKVTRDRLMCELDEAFPEYGWARNKGYGTAEHRRAIEKFGVTEHHRRSFKPIRMALQSA